jgi:hypothetical protein
MSFDKIIVATRVMEEEILAFAIDHPKHDCPDRRLPDGRKAKKTQKIIERPVDRRFHSFIDRWV